MKPEHRHELKTNELAEWIANFPQWAKKNRRMIIYVSVVFVLVTGSYFYRRYQKNVVQVREQLKLTNLINQLSQSKTKILQNQTRGFDTSYVLIQTADNLQIAAQNAKNDAVAAFALIKRAQALRMELHYRLETASEQEIAAQINRAKASYTEALEKSSPNPSLTATAKFGLGLCEEELGNFEKAEQIYRDIDANTDFEGTVAAAQAKQRLDTMADYQQKVVFKPSPKPKPPAALESPTELKPADTNQAPQTPNSVSEVPDINLPGGTPDK